MSLQLKPKELKPKDRAMAIVLALAGGLLPGIHKVYLGQWGWAGLYLVPGLLFWHSSMGYLPRLACLFEVTWLLLQGQAEFDRRFNEGILSASTAELSIPLISAAAASTNFALASKTQASQAQKAQVENLAQSLRQLEALRQEGLISEYEFEQQRRQLLS